VNDADDGVRQASAKMVGVMRGERLRPFIEPLSDLIESAAFPHALPQLLITLSGRLIESMIWF